MSADTRARATIAQLRARVAELEAAAWQSTDEGQRAHVAGYAHRRAIEHAARKYAHLGPGFLALLAARLREVDTEGGILHAASAQRTVEAWAGVARTETRRVA